MSKIERTSDAHCVNQPRRGFIGKILTGGAALAAIPALSTVVLGQDRPERGGNGDQRNPAKMAEAMIKRFDKDGDRALNRRELTEALTALLRHRQGERGGQGGGQGGGGGQGQGRPAQGQGGDDQRQDRRRDGGGKPGAGKQGGGKPRGGKQE